MVPALRRIARWASPALALLLGAVLVAGSLHQHSDLRAHDDCALCATAHTPAAPVAAAAGIEVPQTFPHPLSAHTPTPRARLTSREVSPRAPPAV